MQETTAVSNAPRGPVESGAFVATPRHPSRAVAGLLLAAHRHAGFEVLDSGLIRVPSASTPGLKYTVDLSGKGRCTCPFWAWGDPHSGTRANDKHVIAAEFVWDFRRAAPGVSYGVVRSFDVGLDRHVFRIFERSTARGCVGIGFALSLESALFNVIDRMQDDIARAGASL